MEEVAQRPYRERSPIPATSTVDAAPAICHAGRRLLGEVTAHEVAHQWHTNRRSSRTIQGEHCNDFRYYDDPDKRCLMNHTYSSLPEFFDNIVRFHYVMDASGVDSEYRWIRERCEPIPANALLTFVDWWTQAAPPCR
jgi:hypothetical protein